MNIALPSLQPSSVLSVETCKATIFKIVGHWFALPATTILKVVPLSALRDDAISKLTVWDNRPLVRLDLHQLLTHTADDRSSNANDRVLNLPHYMIIVWSQTGERCGIPVDELPVLNDLCLTEAQVLPPHYRQSIGYIAKYMVIHSYQGGTKNVLLLDLQRSLNKTVVQ